MENETAEPPPDNLNNVISEESSPETDLTLSPTQRETHITNDPQNSPETQSPPPNTTLDAPVSDSQEDDSSEQPLNPNSTDAAAPPPKKRRRRKRFFTEINANPSFRRHRVAGGLAKEVDVEALIAISVGFPVDSLSEEEIEANVVSTIGGTEQSNYIVVRNHILARWRWNVSIWLTREHALESIRAEHKNLVDSAYDFLLEHGYINFGVAPPIKEAQMGRCERVQKANIVVVGAGLAGLVAARQLVGMGFKVVVLEGRARAGGRVKTMKMKGDGVVAAADLGGSVLTGINGNPLGVLARQLSLPLHKDDPYEMGGDHCFIPGGNDTFVRELAKDLPIFYERTVESIRYGVDGIIVYASGQEFHGDMVLCTVPLGVLKKGSIEFFPELPQRKKDAIQRLGYGLLNKVALLFPYNFWGGEIDTFGHLTEDSSMRGEFFLFYSYSSVSGGPLLIALVAGEAAVKFETKSPVESVRRVLQILRGIFHPKGIAVPDPVQAVCTRWGKDCFTYGSYSYVAVGSSGDDYDILAESVGDGRVFFAGEATNKQYPATMHGAFLSGMREAANILREAKKRSLALTDKVNNDVEEDDLTKLFDIPDLTFGSFSILFDPRTNDLESLSLLRVKFQGPKLDSCFLCLYGLLSRKQAIELCELDDDGKRLKTLYLSFQVKLVGRKGLSHVGDDLIAHIKEARARLGV
ncbi:lysine-specific histone demethylase 1 homolog 1 isoform X2 [Ricinus communis]|uniref:lysine-specific histone demethylase 1 homolog 1 isoform X2 n=1 Tax=Ricinus communis TaxID=3988 RepID=UPI000772A68C|nr:lysine-specific histone demethylase 1 homolog 1 isoform X2 [Ricinus communis]|eukprot:XP_015581227.1 lysine-specific histone demethylase 1 homolog 1 isoform X2 [Ricinus communis]